MELGPSKETPEKKTGLFDKLLILHLCSVTILFLLIVVSYYYIEKNSFNNQLIKKSNLIRDLLEISCVDPIVSTIAYDRIGPAINILYRNNKEIIYIEIYDLTAHIIASVGNIPASHLGIEEINQLFKKDSISNQHSQPDQNNNDLITYLNVGDRPIGLIRMGVTKKSLKEQLKKNILYFLGFFIIAIAITSLIFYLFTDKWIIVPIIRVSKIMKTYGEDELKTLFTNIKKYNTSKSTDEIGTMSTAFERMVSSIIKRTEEKEKAENRYRLIAENVADVIWTMDLDLKYTYISPSMYQLRGYSSKEAMKQSLEEMLTPGSFKKVMKLFANTLTLLESGSKKGFKPIEFELQQKCKNGSIIWTSNNARIFNDPDKQKLNILGITRDITHRKQEAEKLSKARNYIKNIIDSMPSLLVGLDQDGTVSQWNIEAQKRTGISLDSAIGQPFYKIIPHLKTKREKIDNAIKIRRQFSTRRAYYEDGDRRFEDIVVYPLISNGVEGAVIRVDDITEQVRMEEMMVQNEKMLSVGGLAAGMAHEINNPLAGIMQTSDVMAGRLKKIDMPANIQAAQKIGIKMEDIKAFMDERGILRMTDTIHNSGERIAKIVENMLSFARKNDDANSSHDPAQLLDKILDLAATDYDLKKQYDFKAIEIVKKYQKDLPLITCDGAKIQQVLLNILKNGSQAMHEAVEKNDDHNNPKFILQLSHETLTDMLRIEIEDNGPGMDEKTRKRIFEPFFTTKPVGEGTGLGLSVSYFIITENHDGEMSVESTPGSGAKFIIRLPLKGK